MSTADELLDRLVAGPAFAPDWGNVRDRAAARRLPRNAWTIALAAALAAIVVGSALAAAGIGPFRSWLTGEPGRPASAAAVRAFTAANGHSWESFPRTTKLRELIDTRFDGQRYVLYGFRSGESACLQLVAVDLQAKTPPACAPISAIHATRTAIVPLDAQRSIEAFPQRRSPEVSFGLAADQVKNVAIRTVDGTFPAAVGGDAYVWVDPTPSSFEDVQTIGVTLRNGRAQTLTPHTFASPRPPVAAGVTAGPTRVTAPIRRPRIAWLDRGEPRGLTLAQAHIRLGMLHVPTGYDGDFRVFKPDPSSDLVVGLSRDCIYLSDGIACGGRFALGPLSYTVSGGSSTNSSDAFDEIGGAAADGVAAIRAFLPDGSSQRIALKDNAFAGLVPAGQPLKLVAYDTHSRVVAIETDVGFLRPPAPSTAKKRLRPTAVLRGPRGTTARLSTGATGSSILCWELATSAGARQGNCLGVPLTGPWISPIAVQTSPGDVFVAGWLRAPVTSIRLRFDDGSTGSATVRGRWFLAAIPARALSTSQRRVAVEGLDASGHVVQHPLVYYKEQ